MNKVTVLSPLLVVSLLAGCAGNLSRAESSPSAFVSQASSMDGQAVTVRGYVRFGDHARQIWDNETSLRDADVGSCLTLINTTPHRDILGRSDRRYARVVGVIRANINEGHVDYGSCNDVGLELVSVMPLN